jgi:hypothetical protein
VFGAILLACVWHSFLRVSSPTLQEYAVYKALLPHIAEGSRKRIVAQKRTSALSLPEYDRDPTPVPAELRITRIEETCFPEFEDFCGRCGNDFVKKNVRAWPLQPGLEYLSVPRATLTHDDSILVNLSRVGFNVSHTRAVVMFTAICSDAGTRCVELGQAYLKGKGNEWIVDRVSGNVF